MRLIAVKNLLMKVYGPIAKEMTNVLKRDVNAKSKVTTDPCVHCGVRQSAMTPRNTVLEE
jgi:hypothetical protein